MQPSSSQKILKVLSIISIVTAVVAIIGAVILFASGVFFAVADPADTAEAVAEMEIDQVEAGTLVGAVGIITFIEGIISLVMGILGLRAAKDNQKIMPLWWLAVIGLAFDVIAVCTNLFNGGLASQSGLSAITSCAVSFAIFWLANTIKKEAGK